jgi:hypothetical protein
MGVELAIAAWVGFDLFRRRNLPPAAAEGGRTPLSLPISMGLLLAVGVATVGMAMAWGSTPHGDWDAWAIWNLRARFLAADAGLAQRAWSPVLAATSHPAYPLLVSSFIGRCWSFGHSFSAAVPAATGYVFFLALIALVAGGVAALRGPMLGLLAGLLLAGSPSLLHQVPAEYADVPLACYFVAALIFALLEHPIWAGVFAGLAAWTKDEGLLFLLVLLVGIAIFRRKAVAAALVGALPGAVLAILFKTSLSGGGAPQIATSAPAALQHLADPGRYGIIASAFGHEFLGMGSAWYHPILPLLVLAIALRFDRRNRREMVLCAGVAAALLAGFFGVYVFTANDLPWMLQTSLGRLLVQVWPVLVLAGVIGLRQPEAMTLTATAPAEKAGGRSRQRRTGSRASIKKMKI